MQMLTLLPVQEVDENIHRMIYRDQSSTKIFNTKIDPGSKLYLAFCEEHGWYSLYQDARRKETISRFPRNELETSTIVLRNLKQFQIAGIEPFWRATRDGKFEVRFYVNLSKTEVQGSPDLEKKLAQLSQYRVAPIINEFLKEQAHPVDLFQYVNQEDQMPDLPSSRIILNEVEYITKNWQPSSASTCVHTQLPNCQLMNYQTTSVKWMVEREKKPEIENLKKFADSVQIYPARGYPKYPNPFFYYPSFGLFSESDPFINYLNPRGGILADESGLGKTIEVISLIMSHQKRVFYELPNSRKNEKMKKFDGKSQSRKCTTCQETCDLKECGWNGSFDTKDNRFNCIQCIAIQTPVEVPTTLIAVPEVLIPHWLDKICMNNLKVKIYSGLDVDGYLNPLEIADLDVILVSYETLRTELAHTSKKVSIWDSKSKSNKMQNISVTSLTHVKWWRFVADESQSINNLVAQFCQLISSVNRWCVTSSPIKNSYSDLLALFKLIQFWPFNIEQFWKIAVLGFHNLSKRKGDLSETLLVQLTSQIMRKTKRFTVRHEMGIPKLVEIEQVVELSLIEDFRYKKEMEDVKDAIKKKIKNYTSYTDMSEVNEKESIFKIIESLKETLISGGEHDEKKMLKNIKEEVYAEPKNCMIRQIHGKKMEVIKAFSSTIENLLSLAEVYNLDGLPITAKKYADVVDVLELIEEINHHTDRMKSPETVDASDGEAAKVEDDVRIRKSNRKRGPTKNSGKPRKIKKFENSEAQLEAEKKAKEEIAELKKFITNPIYDEKLTLRFVVNMLEVSKKFRNDQFLNNAIDKMGGKDKLIASLCAMIERLSKDERGLFEIVEEEHLELAEGWDKTTNRHTEMCKALEEIKECYKPSDVDDPQSLVWKFTESAKARSLMMEMSFWPIFKDSQKHLKDGKVGDTNAHDKYNCMGVCNNSNFQVISENYELATNQEMLQHIFKYINGLEKLRSKVMTSYTSLVSYFQAKHLNTATMIHEKSDTIMCVHIQGNYDVRSKRIANSSCLVCATKFVLDQLSFEIGVGSFHGNERDVRGKLAIEKFLTMLLGMEKKIHPNFDFSKEFSEFVEYLQHLRQTVDNIRLGCSQIEAYSGSLRNLYRIQKPLDMDDLRCLHECRLHRTAKDLKNVAIDKYTSSSDSNEKNLKSLCADLRYFISLYEQEGSTEEKGDEEQSCPICMDNWTNLSGFVGFPCGHRVCQNCYPHFRNQQNAHNHTSKIKCSTCRKQFYHADVIVARDKGNRMLEQSLIPGVSLSSKLRETIKLMREVLAKGVDENVVLFTTSEVGSMMWKYLINVFEKAELPFAEGNNAQRGSAFRFSAECRILICSHGMDHMGLDLTNANYVIFLDPTDSLSVFENSWNRVMRIGQKRVVTVYNMGVESSVDDDIRRKCRPGYLSEWIVDDIQKMFNITFNAATPRIDDDDDDEDAVFNMGIELIDFGAIFRRFGADDQ